MPRVFVKPLWNVRHNQEPEKTTLNTESVERRHGTSRGYCVTADSAKEARAIVFKYTMQRKHDIAECDKVRIVEHRGVAVLMDAPRW